MIKTFRNHESERIFLREGPQSMPSGFQRIAQRKLAMLDASDCREDLRSPPRSKLNRVYNARPEGTGQRSDDRRWLRFSWFDGDIYNVEITDYRLGAAA